MGLTIHYSLSSEARPIDGVRELVRRLRDRAKVLPFDNVGELLEVSDKTADFRRRSPDDPHRWLLIQAARYVEHEEYSFTISPRRVIAFATSPGDGCEPANFGLCQYSRTVRTPDGKNIPGNVPPGWSWRSFCKTQYASNPGLGGIDGFLKCHLSVVRLLDAAGELGLKPDVLDESGYWKHRRVEVLVEEIGRWNQGTAALVGRIKDMLGGGKEVQSEITRFPDYEHLEAKGRQMIRR